MAKFSLKKIAVLVLLTGLWASAAGATIHGDFDANRAKLLGYMVRQQLERHHYSHKPVDDEFSRAAFHLYLKQLDFQKRFLLKDDVARLEGFTNRIDDEFNAGRTELPEIGAALMQKRIPQVQKMAEDLLAGTFDFTTRETLETDAEKLDYCDNLEQLRERWRKILKFQVLSRYLNLLEDEGDQAKPEELRTKARQKVLKSNQNFFDRMLQETPQDHYDRYLNAVTRAFDPHTTYLPPTQKEDFDISMRGSLEGIGATLREEDGYIKVVRIIPGSAAYRQGQLHAEDIILEVAQGSEEPVDVTDTRLREAVALIRGPKGTEVRLTVKSPDGTRKVIPIVRDVVQIEETFVKGATLDDAAGGKRFGYIKIPSFYRDFKMTHNGADGRNATDDVRKELKKMAGSKIEGLILDLRNNGGGALNDAVGIAGLFIETGPVVQVRNSNGRMNVLRDTDPAVEYSGPMVVLVNQFSASASEILAGALQDYGRAIVIGGAHTHGKGTVQTILDLDRNIPLPNMGQYRPLGALKVTTQKFYRINGGSTQYRGVIPDIILPDRMGHLKSGEQYADYSLPWDTVEPTDFVRWPGGLDQIEQLKRQSSQRVSADEDFREITQDAALAREKSEQTLQSLNLEDVRREREEAQKSKTSRSAFHGTGEAEGADEDQDRNAELSEAERRKLWIDETAEDPYVEEAMTLLGDLLAISAEQPGIETAQPAAPKAANGSPYSRRNLQ